MTEIKIEKVIKTLLYLVPSLTLLFISGFFYPFILTRTLYFILLIQLALSLYIFLLALNFKKYKPHFNLATLLFLSFLAINFLAAIFGLDFYNSFWSSFERMEGVISLIYLSFYLFLLTNIFKDKKDWLLNIRVILAVSCLVSLYGIVQRYNIFNVFEAGTTRVGSTIGNSAFLAGFLLLAIGSGLYYYFQEENKKYRNISLAVTFLNLAVLLMTGTRGAILGLVVGLFVFMIINAIFVRGKLRQYSIAGILIVLIAVSGFYFFRHNLAQSNISTISRLASISLNDATVRHRLIVWRMAINEFKERPLLGVGMENFNVVYNKYFTPDISENWFDRTHNIYLDQLMNSGIMGLLLYLSILFYLFYRLFLSRKENYWLFAIFSSTFIAYGIHNFFVFDTINTSFFYVFLIGFISINKIQAIASKQDQKQKLPTKSLPIDIVIALLVIANIYVAYKVIYQPYKINRNLFIGYYYTLADTNRAYESFKTALSYKYSSAESAYQLGTMADILAEKGAQDKENVEKFYKLADEKLEFAANNFPYDIRIKIFLAQLIINNHQQLSELDEAESLLNESIKLSPYRKESYYLLHNLYLRKGDNEKAIKILEDYANKLRWYGEAKLMLASALQKQDAQKANEYFNESLEQGFSKNEVNLKKAIEFLLNDKRYQEALPLYLDLIVAVPERYDYRIDLSKIYYLTGDTDRAIEQINIVNDKAPDALKGNEPYLNMLYDAYNKE